MDIVGQIYEAAAVPELWPNVLENLTRQIGAGGCTLITIDQSEPVWMSSHDIRPFVELYFTSGWAQKNDRMQRLLVEGHTGFVRDIDLYSRETIAELPLVRDFQRPRGYGWSAALATPVPSGEILLFSIEQLWANGPISDATLATLEALRPHISRASLLTAKLRFERAKAAVEAFGLASIPAALVRANGVVVAANDLFLHVGQQLTIGARDRLRIGFDGAAALLETALRTRTDGKRPPLSIAIPAQAEAPPLVLHVLPAEGSARDIFGAATALLLVTRIETGPVPQAGLLRALFDLTPAEAKIAQAVLAGEATDEIAKRFSISAETLKTHMKAVLRKTGFRRRVDFVRFLSGLPSFEIAHPPQR